MPQQPPKTPNRRSPSRGRRKAEAEPPRQPETVDIAISLSPLEFRSPASSRRKALEALRTRLDERPDAKAMLDTIMNFKSQQPDIANNDRAIALLLGAILEQGLELAILSHCIVLPQNEERRLFGPPQEAPITFDVKIRLGYALGIYGSDSRDDLISVRHIRNLFAHIKTIMTFASDEVRDVCLYLKCVRKIASDGEMGIDLIDPRNMFIEAILHYYVFLAAAHEKPLRYTEHELSELYS
jgi:hypothetical protein